LHNFQYAIHLDQGASIYSLTYGGFAEGRARTGSDPATGVQNRPFARSGRFCGHKSTKETVKTKSVARRIVDRHVLRLIKLWLKAPIEERDEGNGPRRIGGGKSNVIYWFLAGAPGSTAAMPSGLMLKAKKINGSLPGFPHWCTRAYGS
jgi:hypothetical protein